MARGEKGTKDATGTSDAFDVRGRRIHFMGVAGSGVSAIARIALERGAAVSGCDLRANAASEGLVAKGAVCYLGHSPRHLDEVDLLVHSSAVPPDNPELAAAHEAGIEVLSRTRMLARLMEDHSCIAVAGSHGKTTTTCLVAHMLIAVGMDPTVMVGGMVPTLAGNFREGESEWFVTEVDESDALLLEIRPRYSIVTNIDREHLDCYPDLDAIVKTFGEYLARTRPDGVIIACADDERLRALLAGAAVPVLTYGFSPAADVRGTNLVLGDTESRFDVVGPSLELPGVTLRLPGEHNVQNSLAVVALGFALGVPEADMRDSLLSSPRVERRLEAKWNSGGIRMLDDYAHHPTEVVVTLKAARGMTKGRLIAVFQPHRYSRTVALLDDFARAFDGADQLVVTATSAANEPPRAGVTGSTLAEAVRRQGAVPVEYIPRRENIIEYLMAATREGDTILSLGAGDIGALGDELRGRF